MTPGELKKWRELMGWTQRQAAEGLGVALSTYQSLELGKNWATDAPVRALDRRTRLACSALLMGLKPYGNDGVKL